MTDDTHRGIRTVTLYLASIGLVVMASVHACKRSAIEKSGASVPTATAVPLPTQPEPVASAPSTAASNVFDQPEIEPDPLPVGESGPQISKR